MKRLKSEDGIALVMVLVLAAISLAIMAALVFMLTASTEISGIQKRYKTATDAGKGGADVFYQVIARRGNATDTTNFLSQIYPLDTTKYGVNTPATCTGTNSAGVAMTGLAAKLNTPSSSWSGCDNSVVIDPVTGTSYDMFIDLPSGTGTYRVYAKIVDTLEGNSSGDTGLIKSGVVNANAGEVPAMNKPYVYTIEVDAENPNNPMERAKYSILYLY